MSHIPRTKFFFAVIVIAFGSGFQHGYHTGVLDLPTKMFQRWINETQIQKLIGKSYMVTVTWSTVVSIFCMGGIVGAFLVGYLSDKHGRKKILMWNNGLVLLTIILFVGSKLGNSLVLFLCGRLIAGVNAGLNSGICQIYLTEIAPNEIRGAIGSLYQVMICISIFISQLAGLACGNEETWSLLFVLPIIPAIFQVISLYFCPESPKYLLMTKDDEKETIKALIWLRDNPEVLDELNELITEDNLVKQLRITSLKRVFSNQSLRRCLLKCTLMNIGQQVCGINIMIYFSPYIELNLKENVTAVAIVLSIFYIISTVLAALLVDILGRRILLMSSFFAMGITTIIFAYVLIKSEDNSSYIKYFVVAATILFFISHAIGVGSIPWFITAEYFNYSVRSFAVAVTVGFNWFFNFLISQTFLQLKEDIGNYVFVIFVILDFFFFCYTIDIREVNQMSPIEILEMLKK